MSLFRVQSAAFTYCPDLQTAEDAGNRIVGFLFLGRTEEAHGACLVYETGFKTEDYLTDLMLSKLPDLVWEVVTSFWEEKPSVEPRLEVVAQIFQGSVSLSAPHQAPQEWEVFPSFQDTSVIALLEQHVKDQLRWHLGPGIALHQLLWDSNGSRQLQILKPAEIV